MRYRILPPKPFVNREEQERSQIERRFFADPFVQADESLYEVFQLLRFVAELVEDSPAQQIPQRRHSDHDRDMAGFESVGNDVAGEVVQVRDLRATAESAAGSRLRIRMCDAAEAR